MFFFRKFIHLLGHDVHKGRNQDALRSNNTIIGSSADNSPIWLGSGAALRFTNQVLDYHTADQAYWNVSAIQVFGSQPKSVQALHQEPCMGVLLGVRARQHAPFSLEGLSKPNMNDALLLSEHATACRYEGGRIKQIAIIHADGADGRIEP